MLIKSIAGIFFAIGGAFAVFVVLFLVVGWGEWHCGINDFNAILGSAIAGACLTIGNLLWRSRQPTERRQELRKAFLPIWIFGALIAFLAIGIPVCPFPSR